MNRVAIAALSRAGRILMLLLRSGRTQPRPPSDAPVHPPGMNLAGQPAVTPRAPDGIGGRARTGKRWRCPGITTAEGVAAPSSELRGSSPSDDALGDPDTGRYRRPDHPEVRLCTQRASAAPLGGAR